MKVEPIKKTRHVIKALEWLANKVNVVITQSNEHDDKITELQKRVDDLQKQYNDLSKMKITAS